MMRAHGRTHAAPALALALVTSLCTLPAARADAQAAPGAAALGEQARRSRLQRTVDVAIYTAIVPVLDSAEARGLPLDPLVDKALYGAMRGEPAARIRTALAAHAERLRAAQEALTPAPTAMEIAAGADALAIGVPRATLRTIRIAAARRSVAVPLGVLTELVAQRVPLARASSMVVALLHRGATPAQLVALGTEVQKDIRDGVTPDAALDLRTRGVIATLPAGAGIGAGNAAATSPGDRGGVTLSAPRKP